MKKQLLVIIEANEIVIAKQVPIREADVQCKEQREQTEYGIG
ncbi:hypothetical protein OM416_01505 [Paenibacillus sp. LS1]|nr:hypothetical protein [Paenibacillus sp. LS1]